MKPVAPVTKYFAIAARRTKRRGLDNAAHRDEVTQRRESTLFKVNIGICHGSNAFNLVRNEGITTRRGGFPLGYAYPQKHPLSPRRRSDEFPRPGRNPERAGG